MRALERTIAIEIVGRGRRTPASFDKQAGSGDPARHPSRRNTAEVKTGSTTFLFLLLCLLTAIQPLLSRPPSTPTFTPTSSSFPGWAAAPIPAGLTPLTLSPREARFAQQFPGQIAAFSDGQTTWLVRWLAHPTRKLHPATDCLRATGYAISPEPIFAAGDGTHWGTLTATRGNEKLLVRERIIDAHGREFTDVSAWFWSAAFEKSPGPWWCVTRIEEPN